MTKKRVTQSVPDYGDNEINAIALACAAVERLSDSRARHRLMNWMVSKYLGDEAMAAIEAVLPSDRARGCGLTDNEQS